MANRFKIRATGQGLRTLFFGRRPHLTILRILILVVATFVTFRLILLPVRVTGLSMEPTCRDGQLGAINLLAYARQAPQRGDIVAIRMEAAEPVMLKRVIGLPGERIAFHSGALFINGVRVAEPYLTSPDTWEWPEETLDHQTYFVAGDNRSISRQFRVGRGQIFGKLFGQSGFRDMGTWRIE